jgi:hydroxypyruvate isomerase
MLASLHYADRLAGPAGLTVLLEALNPTSEPDYFYSHVADVATIIAASGTRSTRILFDLFHIGMVGDAWQPLLETHFHEIGHIQIASVPERHEPDRGRLHYRPVMATLTRLGYQGWIGAEYQPLGDVESGLGWRDHLRG